MDLSHIFFGTLLGLSSLFLILLVLVQQGKGGGLAGAFGGGGGQSAFGTKAGDVFTRVTIITALVWIVVCMLTIRFVAKPSSKFSGDSAPSIPAAAPADKKLDLSKPATDNKSPSGATTAPMGETIPPAVPMSTVPMSSVPMNTAPMVPETTTPPAPMPEPMVTPPAPGQPVIEPPAEKK